MGIRTTDTPTASGKLGAFSIWAIGVSLVISGESFGWNIGWSYTGPVLFFVPVIISAAMYYALIHCLIELACVYPNAEGPHVYTKNAFGKHWGWFIAIAILFEFLFAAPAIASSVGEYIGFLNNNLGIAPWIASGFLFLFCLINLFDLSLSVLFAIILTILAIAELFIFQTSVITEFSAANLFSNTYGTKDFTSVVQALPFAIWMLLAIEGISLMTRNVRKDNFRKHIAKGYVYSFWTLIILGVSVLFLAGGGIVWNLENWETISNDNHPMPASLALILGKSHIITQVFTFLGLFGLIASLQGVLLAAITQVEQFITISGTSDKQRRILSSVLVFAVSMLAIWGSQTSFLIELSVFGAVTMYFGTSLSLFKLRKENSDRILDLDGVSLEEGLNYRHSDFKDKKPGFYTGAAIVFSFFSMLALAYLLPYAALFFVVLALGFILSGRLKKKL